ncbi:peptide chain release factor-like protein [Candidatus Carsonella ruddii]|uniref:Peptide chain release factor 1 n=1 Tax=Candidatus Carsonella ruddii (Diaphorina cf. continua) TaxID=2661587 RepID=A0A7R6VYB1_CARRU|nr:peptide chain release factor-like protein [Candidatus Carsonella ruddii (Diaphorina cf. continua)]BCG49267.1 peptide chain release factor 1 [Candidatus Carsonella ruddii (Diaphorina cf. continua)]
MNNELILEIRQGIGGAEAVSFLNELKKMYLKFFQKKNIEYEILINNNKEFVAKICNNKYKDFLINESGIHRVQRVPKSENQGRLHTSTCSIFVDKYKKNNLLIIKDKDLKIETCKSSGAGGQHINTTNSAVKITHLPTNISVECSDERSQILNKNKALLILKLKINNATNKQNKFETNLLRKNIISKSERSKKTKTYNFPNNKIIDHNKNVSYYQLDKILDGNLDFIFKN